MSRIQISNEQNLDKLNIGQKNSEYGNNQNRRKLHVFESFFSFTFNYLFLAMYLLQWRD